MEMALGLEEDNLHFHVEVSLLPALDSTREWRKGAAVL